MKRRAFLKGALAAGGAAVLAPAIGAAPGGLRYVRYYDTNIGAPKGTLAWFGKHTQWKYCPKDGKIRAYGGDGNWSLQDTGFKPQQSLNAVLAYDFGNGGKLEQETKQWGDPADGTLPNYHDGCTWVYNSQDDKYYAIPGYPVSRIASQADPHKLIKINVVHKFVRATKKWEEGPPVGKSWVQEHWGGAYDPKRNRVWIQCQGQGEFGSVRWFDCGSGTFGEAGLPRIPGLARFPNLGYEVRTERWPQAINSVTDELICFDGYRGVIVGIPLSTLVPRVIANVPGLRSDSPEPVGAIETGLTISLRRQKVFLTYSQQSWAVIGGKGGVWTADLKTGGVEHTPYPNPPGEDSSWTNCEYDDTNDCLILAGNLDPMWGRRFLRYELADARGKSAAMSS